MLLPVHKGNLWGGKKQLNIQRCPDMPKIAPSSSPLCVHKYAFPWVYVLSKEKEKWGSAYDLCMCAHNKVWN